MRLALVPTLLFALGFGSCEAGPKTGKTGTWNEFEERLKAYNKVHEEAQKQVPQVKDKADPAAITAFEGAMAAALRKARPNAKQGDIFTPKTAAAITAALKAEIKGPENKPTRDALRGDDNPKPAPAGSQSTTQVPLEVNATYPKDAPLSTVPPSVLARLPELPEDMEYRFVGRTLILRDVDANIIIDFLPGASPAI